MNTRYKIVLSSQVPNAGIFPNELGYPDPAYMANNICIIEKGNPSHKIELNNNILREVLLDNKDFCLKYLGIKIYDQSEEVGDKIKVETRTVTKKVKVYVDKKEEADIIEMPKGTVINDKPLPFGIEKDKEGNYYKNGKLISKEMLATLGIEEGN